MSVRIPFISSGEAAVISQPKAEDRPVAKGSAFELIRRLNQKEFDNNNVVVDEHNIALRWADESPITFGDLAYREENVVRENGTVGANYPNVWLLMQSECSAALNMLGQMPNKVRQNSGNFRPKAGKKNNVSQPKAENVDLTGMVAAAVAAALAEALPAKPEPAKGHRKVSAAKPQEFKSQLTVGELHDRGMTDEQISQLVELGIAKPVPVTEPENNFAPGDVILVNGVAVQISADGKRLNKTIV